MSALWARYLKGGCDAVIFVFDVSTAARGSGAAAADGHSEEDKLETARAALGACFTVRTRRNSASSSFLDVIFTADGGSLDAIAPHSRNCFLLAAMAMESTPLAMPVALVGTRAAKTVRTALSALRSLCAIGGRCEHSSFPRVLAASIFSSATA